MDGDPAQPEFTVFALLEARALLERTPRLLDPWLRGLPDAWLDADEGPGTWSPREVVAHLVDSEIANWMPRVKRILEHGERLAFEPLRDDGGVAAPRRPIGELLDQFSRARGRSLGELDDLRGNGSDLDRRGRHPDLGQVTLRNLLATWTVHDQAHVAQIARVLAKRYAQDVGPWTAYLSVLSRR
jgi:hypothetical protein